MSKYPYPVLYDEGSSYADGIDFSILFLKSMTLPDGLRLEFNIKMNSNTLLELVSAGKAKMILKVQNKIHTAIYDVDIMNGSYYCTLDLEKIPSSDTLQCTAYIVACEAITLSASKEFISLYDEDYSVTLSVNDVLAVSNIEKLSYSTNNNDFIKFSVSEKVAGTGYQIEYKANSNFVNVLIGPEFNIAYGVIKNNKKSICTIFDSHLVFEIFIHILIDLVQQYEYYKEAEWYSMFEQVFLFADHNYDSFEAFIKAAKDDDIINLTLIYEMAHKMINNQIENSIIAISKMED